MTPSELKVQLLKKLEDEIDKYMDGTINDDELHVTCGDLVEDFTAEHEEL